jgi:hypothetical protein
MSRQPENKDYQLLYAIITHKKLVVDWKEVANRLSGNVTGNAARLRWDALKRRLERDGVVEPSSDSPVSGKKLDGKATKDKKVVEAFREEFQEEVNKDDQEEELLLKREDVTNRSQSVSEERTAAEIEMQKKGKRNSDAMRARSTSVKVSKGEPDSDGGYELEKVDVEIQTFKRGRGRPRKVAKKDVKGKGKEKEEETVLAEDASDNEEDQDVA